MIKVNSRVNLNMPLFQKLAQVQAEALERTAEQLHQEVQQAQVVPRMTGNLQGEAMFVDCSESFRGKVSIVHNTPYARRLYYHPEYDFHQEPWEDEWTDENGKTHRTKYDGNPNAKGHWFEDWEEGGEQSDFAIETYAKIYKELAGL